MRHSKERTLLPNKQITMLFAKMFATRIILLVFLSTCIVSLPFGIPFTQSMALQAIGKKVAVPSAPLGIPVKVLHEAKPSVMMPARVTTAANILDHSAESIIVPFDQKAEKQGIVGACHIFTTTQVLYKLFNEATDKVLHTNSFFADHMLNPARYGLRKGMNAKDFLLDYHLGSIEGIRKAGGRSCDDDLGLEAGLFDNNLQLLQNLGSLLVEKNREWKYMDSAVEKINKERRLLVSRNVEVDPKVAKDRISSAGLDYIYSKSAFFPEMTDLQKADREVVKQVVRSLKPIKINIKKTYGTMPMPEAIKKSKKDLISMLHLYGVGWLGVDYVKYMSRAYFPKEIVDTSAEFPSRGDHAISLVGYRKEGDLFIVKDSNFRGTRSIKATNLLLALEEAIFVEG